MWYYSGFPFFPLFASPPHFLSHQAPSLWHQLTEKVDEFVKNSNVRDRVNLLDFYEHFVSTFAPRLNQLSFARICIAIGSQLRGSSLLLEPLTMTHAI